MDELVVFRKSFEYLAWLRPTVQRYAKVHKYSLGIETQQCAVALLRAIIRANYEEDKGTDIAGALVEYETQRIFIRLAFEYKLLSERQFEYASKLLDEIGRLLRGWQKSAKASDVK